MIHETIELIGDCALHSLVELVDMDNKRTTFTVICGNDTTLHAKRIPALHEAMNCSPYDVEWRGGTP